MSRVKISLTHAPIVWDGLFDFDIDIDTDTDGVDVDTKYQSSQVRFVSFPSEWFVGSLGGLVTAVTLSDSQNCGDFATP